MDKKQQNILHGVGRLPELISTTRLR